MSSRPVPAAAAVERPRDRIPELDGIRGLAILIVIYGHYIVRPHAASQGVGWLISRTGILAWSGVDLFFVLSGFLIGGILIDGRPGQSYYQSFYVRRALRILPLYVLVCGIGLILTRTIPALIPVLGRPMPLWAYATFTENFWLVRNSWDVYQTATWSLAIEEQFYLTLPLIVRVVEPRKLLVTTATLAAASVVLRSTLFVAAGPGFHVLMPCRADGLMLGVVGAIVVREPRLRQWLATTRWPLRGAALLFGAAAGIYLWQGWQLHSAPGSTVGFSILALFFLALLLLAVCQPNSAWARLMRLAPLRRLGQLAYCLYLTNEPVLAATRFALRGKVSEGPDWPAVAIASVVTIALSELSWRLFESKLIAIGHRLSYSRPHALAVATPPGPAIS